jgi:hypothetical protein
MTLSLNGEITAVYLEQEIVCPLCATEEELTGDPREEGLMLEELEGQLDELWCDRCGTQVFSSDSKLAARSRDMYDLLPHVQD